MHFFRNLLDIEEVMVKHMMSLFLLLMTIGRVEARAAEALTATDGLWPQYGYIGLCVALLAITVTVLIKKPARKLNE